MSLPKWDTLSADQKKLFARQAEVFAGYTAYTDYEIGRVIQQVEDMGKLDNTLIIYIVGDNGTSPEGTLSGTPNQWTSYNGILDFPIAEQLKFYDAWGSAATYPHMAVAWSWAFDTPFKWTKQVASHFGGTRQGLAISWPGHINDPGGIRNQFHHIIDIVPTILEATGIKAPEMVDGIKQKPIEGVSMAYTFDKANAECALDAQDPVLRDDRQPRNLSRRLVRQHDAAAWAVDTERAVAAHQRLQVGTVQPEGGLLAGQRSRGEDARQAEGNAGAVCTRRRPNTSVLPLDNRSFARAVEPRPSATAGQTVFTYTGVIPGIPTANAPNILGRSYTITAEVEVPQGGGNGMIATTGGRWGGWGLYLLKGKPVFNYNMLILAQYRWEGTDALTPGKHTIVFDYTYDGPGIAKGGSGVLKVDGKVVATGKQANSIAFLQVSDETFDVGVDTRTASTTRTTRCRSPSTARSTS